MSIAEGQSFVNEFPARSEGTAANVGGISLARTRVVPQQPREEKHHEAIGAMEDFEGQKRVVSLQNRPAWQNNNPVVPSPDSAPASQQFEQDNLSFTRFRVDRLTEEQRDAHRRKAEEQRHMQEELARQVCVECGLFLKNCSTTIPKKNIMMRLILFHIVGGGEAKEERRRTKEEQRRRRQ